MLVIAVFFQDPSPPNNRRGHYRGLAYRATQKLDFIIRRFTARLRPPRSPSSNPPGPLSPSRSHSHQPRSQQTGTETLVSGPVSTTSHNIRLRSFRLSLLLRPTTSTSYPKNVTPSIPDSLLYLQNRFTNYSLRCMPIRVRQSRRP